MKELCDLTNIKPFDRCIVSEGYTPSKIIVATDGAVTNTGVAIYVHSKAPGKPTVSNLLCAFTFISKFSIPVNEARGMTQAYRITIIIIIIILNSITIRITHKGNIRTIAIFYHQAWNPVLFSSFVQTVTMS